MIDEEKKLTTISLSKTPKHERSSPSHGHTIANYEIHTNSEEKRDLLCWHLTKWEEKKKIEKSRKEKEVRRLERKPERGGNLGTKEKRDLRFVVT